MAEINTNIKSDQKKIFVKKRTHVDLTPMVDLGFLLLTFFVFTSSMTKPKLMDMVVPNDKTIETNAVCESCALTIVLGKNNQFYYYEGKEENAVYKTGTFTSTAIRKLIMQKKETLGKTDPQLTMQLIIKPSAGSTFKNLVDLVDEAHICALKRYYIVDPNAADIVKAR